jgi:hypothetical protein
MIMTPEMEAAALWGSAQNEAYPVQDRLAMALQALEFFGNECDRLQEQRKRESQAREYVDTLHQEHVR